ncbi:MAG: DUF5317 domain-containing protein [Caldiserica bacterium]|jgi:hypothetical protein|nr:DUF5317 domain-containing protein [Caldisericota bacterium]MDH7561765.1 DUF5317 family protein [Caldisericota bacterium]
MIFWVVVAALMAILLGFLFKGKIENFSRFRLRFWPLVFLSLGLQVLLYSGFSPFPEPWGPILYLFSLLLLVLFLLGNLKIPGMALILVGVFLNFLVIILNSGYMPAFAHAYYEAGRTESALTLEEKGFLNNVRVANESTRLNFLGDWIVLPQPWGIHAVISPGDLVLLMGLFFVLFRGMLQS